MHVAGLDLGTRSTKCVVLRCEEGIVSVASRSNIEGGPHIQNLAFRALEDAAHQIDLSPSSMAYVASTGYGRYQVEFRDIQITEITCHAAAAAYRFPECGNVLDIGAMNSRAMRTGKDGRVLAFRMNDKCASGAGRFLERVARSLDIPLEEIGQTSLRAADPQKISSICAVLAESEVINLVTAGKNAEDILQGAHQAISDRIVTLVKQVGLGESLALTGGVSKNEGMVRALAEKLKVAIKISPDAEYMGALGAALLGLRRLQKRGQQREIQNN
jgi:predicted CoA-substrate-specific enzyme activase